MKLLRNSEVRRGFVCHLLLAVIVTVVAFVWDTQFGWFTLLISGLFFLLHVITVHLRYQKITALSADINRILHGYSRISLDEYAEGELYILQSEVYKMTVRLREQQQCLQNDKLYLADSLADISHQIRTPLTSINLLVSLLSEPDLSVERRQQIFHELYEQLSRIDWLITTLLKISKLDAGTVQFQSGTVPLKELIRKAVAPMLIPMELREQELSVAASGDFYGDSSWTCEALTNIVKNCVEHTPDKGVVTITAVDNPLYTEIVICDNGSGIDPEDLPHIFERFYKGKSNSDKGFGIGLALARMIITEQNGTIRVENVLPHGAKFTIRFYKGTV